MKRTPLKRGKPLARSGYIKRGPIKAKGGSRFPKRRQPDFLAWVRTLPCTVASGECWGRIEAAHVVRRRAAGAWDRGFVAPLCVKHHAEEEGRTAQFNRKYGIDLEAIATELAV